MRAQIGGLSDRACLAATYAAERLQYLVLSTLIDGIEPFLRCPAASPLKQIEPDRDASCAAVATMPVPPEPIS